MFHNVQLRLGFAQHGRRLIPLSPFHVFSVSILSVIGVSTASVRPENLCGHASAIRLLRGRADETSLCFRMKDDRCLYLMVGKRESATQAVRMLKRHAAVDIAALSVNGNESLGIECKT